VNCPLNVTPGRQVYAEAKVWEGSRLQRQRQAVAKSVAAANGLCVAKAIEDAAEAKSVAAAKATDNGGRRAH
jgi:hypothetical protein